MPAPLSFNRRTALAAGAAAAAAATLGSCSRDEPDRSPVAASSSGTPATPSAAPTDEPAAADQGGKKGSHTKPLPTPSQLSESPELAAQVKAGKLPPVDKRLPDVPYVVPHRWLTRGNYGGDLQMLVSSTTGSSIAEWFYGFSILRLLNDSRDLGPGLAERWESNKDASVWTFHFRKGLRWSDGKPWTTDDIMFWWEDMANDDAFVAEGVPDECKSGKGTIATLTAIDAHTLEVRYDAPTPLAADRIACWVSGYGGNGASWMAPKHFAKKFHPKYNPKVPKNWAGSGGLFERKVSFRRNPKCPTMTGFRLQSYADGKSLRWERNPYYYAVTPDGDQLPYLDRLIMTAVQDPEVGKLQVSTGKVDLSYGPFDALQLADVSTLMKGRDQYGYDVLLWDSGSGTASMIYFSQDYYEPEYRKLFREPKFRQALSHAFNRNQARKAIYFDQGDITTGTISPKGLEFVSSAQGRNQYKAWRDSYVTFDQDKAKALLDEIGVIDSNGDGLRELPSGRKLRLRIELQADAGAEHVQKDTQLVRDWKAIGLDIRLNRVPPLSFNDLWAAGKYMTHSNWEAAGPPNSGLINPLWLAPTESSRWAPLQGAMYATRGTKLEKPERDVDPYKRKPPRMEPVKGGPVAQLWDLIDRGATEPDAVKRQAIFFEAVKVHVKYGPFYQGTVANYPVVVVVRNGLHNVPAKANLALGGNVNPWEHPTPACYDPETFYWDKPADHVV